MNTESWAYEHDILVHKQNHNCGIFSWRLTDWMDLDQWSLQGAKSTEINYANVSRKIALLFTCFEDPEKTILSFYITGDSRICHSKLSGIEEQIWLGWWKKQLETFPAVWLIVINTNIPASLISFLLSVGPAVFLSLLISIGRECVFGTYWFHPELCSRDTVCLLTDRDNSRKITNSGTLKGTESLLVQYVVMICSLGCVLICCVKLTKHEMFWCLRI